jgi:hypothetical protein
LLYEHEFLILAQRCQATMEQDKPLYAELTKAIEHKNKYMGELRRTMAMVVSVLNQADQLIENRLSLKPPGQNQQSNQEFGVLHRVSLQFYIGEVQAMQAPRPSQGNVGCSQKICAQPCH